MENPKHASIDNVEGIEAEDDDDEKKRRKRQRYSAHPSELRSENRVSLISSTDTLNNMSFEYSLSKENKVSRDSIKKSIDYAPTNLDDVRRDTLPSFGNNRMGSCFGDFGLLTDNLYPNKLDDSNEKGQLG